jgi:hypothetical protein
MKSHTKPALRAIPAAQVQISLPVQGVLSAAPHRLPGMRSTARRKRSCRSSDRMAYEIFTSTLGLGEGPLYVLG